METFMAKKKGQVPATESQESNTTLIKAPLPRIVHKQLLMRGRTTKAVIMNTAELLRGRLQLMLVNLGENQLSK